MKNYFVYIIKSSLGHIYIGQTSNLQDRLKRHNSNRSNYTKNKGSWELVICFEVSSRVEAISLERKLKNMKNSEKAIEYLKKLVQSTPT